jgi:hypothetical protein
MKKRYATLIAFFMCTACPPQPATTPAQQTVGSLTVTVGYAAGPGVACQGSTTISISGPGPAQSSTLVFGNTGQQLDSAHYGCAVTASFGNLTPGTWAVASSIGGSCVTSVSAGQLATRLIWERVCS